MRSDGGHARSSTMIDKDLDHRQSEILCEYPANRSFCGVRLSVERSLADNILAFTSFEACSASHMAYCNALTAKASARLFCGRLELESLFCFGWLAESPMLGSDRSGGSGGPGCSD